MTEFLGRLGRRFFGNSFENAILQSDRQTVSDYLDRDPSKIEYGIAFAVWNKIERMVQFFIEEDTIRNIIRYNIDTLFLSIRHNSVILFRYILDRLHHTIPDVLNSFHRHTIVTNPTDIFGTFNIRLEVTVLGYMCLQECPDSSELCKMIRIAIQKGVDINQIAYRRTDRGHNIEMRPIERALLNKKYRIASCLLQEDGLELITVRHREYNRQLSLLQMVCLYEYDDRHAQKITFSKKFVDVISLLLRKGEDPNLQYAVPRRDKHTPFSIIISLIDNDKRYNVDKYFEIYINMIKVFLRFDASANNTILNKHDDTILDEPYILKWLGLIPDEIDIRLFSTDLNRASTNGPNTRSYQMDIVFCPVCGTVCERGDGQGCNYLTHNCTLMNKYYNKNLYNKYNENGNITFCVLCGRICSNIIDGGIGHVHLDLISSDAPKARPSTQGATANAIGVAAHWANDCSRLVRYAGGGIREKIMRFHVYRESIKQIQDDGQPGSIHRTNGIGFISQQNAWDIIIEAAWNAPINPTREFVNNVDTEITTRRFILPATEFQTISEVNDPIYTAIKEDYTSYPYPVIPWPDENNMDYHPIVSAGTDAISLDDIHFGIRFHHRQQNGTRIVHPLSDVISIQRMFIGEDDGSNSTTTGSILSIKTRNRLFNHTKNFGACIICNRGFSYNTCPECNSKLYPQELQMILNLYQENSLPPENSLPNGRKEEYQLILSRKEKYQLILNEYSLKFNKKFAANRDQKKGNRTSALVALRNEAIRDEEMVQDEAIGGEYSIRNAALSLNRRNYNIRTMIDENRAMAATMVGGGRQNLDIIITPSVCTENTCTGNACSVSARKSRRTHRTRRARRIQRKRTRKQY